MRQKILPASLAVILIYTATAIAAPPQLKGRYAYTGSGFCITAIGGQPDRFNEQHQLVNGGYYAHSDTLLATRTYNGDGTGNAEGRQVAITVPLPGGDNNGQFVILPSATSSEFKYNFTYNVDAYGIFTTNLVPDSFEGKILTGSRAGQTFTVDKVSFSGLFSGDRNVINVAIVAPEIERVEYFAADDPSNRVAVRQQICQRSRVHTYLGQ